MEILRTSLRVFILQCAEFFVNIYQGPQQGAWSFRYGKLRKAHQRVDVGIDPYSLPQAIITGLIAKEGD